MDDVLIKNVTIVDGTVRQPYRGAVCMAGDTIARVADTPFPDLEAGQEWDGEGLVLSPGFIDLHTHSDYTLVVDPGADSLLRQGVTTEVIGNCGHGVAPLVPKYADDLVTTMLGYDPTVPATWSRFGEYLNYLDARPLGLNVAVLAAHGALRCAVLGLEPRPATSDEIKQMVGHLEEALSAGAVGLSSGLAYAPGANAAQEELVALARVAAEAGGFYASHIRNEDRKIIPSVQEALDIGTQAGLPVHLSHHPVKFPAFGQSTRTISMIHDARARSMDVTCDLHGYIGGVTSMAQLLPPWAFEGGGTAVLRRLIDNDARKAITHDMRDGVPSVAQARLVEAERWSDLFLESCRHSPDCVGMSIAEIADMRGVSPHNAILDLLLAEGEGFYSTFVLGWIYGEDDNMAVLSHESSMIASDGCSLSTTGPLREVRQHPRSYGTFPRVLRKYVRELEILEMPEAIAKMSSRPASRAGLADRGLIRAGYKADLVLFDPQRVADTATYEAPNQYPQGIRNVWVNGALSVQDGAYLGAGSGKVLRGQAKPST